MFDEMISEKLIEWIWVVASIGIVISGVVTLFAGGGFFGFLLAVLYTAIGLLLVRVFCESMLIAFKVYENNRRSLAVMEQMSREQAATRKALQSFLARSSIQSGSGAVPSLALSQASAPSASSQVPPTLKTASKAGWESSYERVADGMGEYDDHMQRAREELQRKADGVSMSTPPMPSKSKLGDWPGGAPGQ